VSGGVLDTAAAWLSSRLGVGTVSPVFVRPKEAIRDNSRRHANCRTGDERAHARRASARDALTDRCRDAAHRTGSRHRPAFETVRVASIYLDEVARSTVVGG
jgi:hypothetical protein